MALQQFPVLAGLGWNISKSSVNSTRVATAASGVEFTAQNWQYPLFKWQLPFNILRQYAAYIEYATLAGFILSQAGQAQNWLYSDPSDNAAVGQGLGAGNATNTQFPLVASVGGFAMPVLYANSVTAVYLNGIVQSGGYTVSQTGYYGPDTISFATPPGAGVSVTADFTFFFVCRFTSDVNEFVNMYNGRWEIKKLEFKSVK